MAVAKISEIKASSTLSFDDAIKEGLILMRITFILED